MTCLNMFYKVALLARSIVTEAALEGPLVVDDTFVKVKRISVRIALAWANLSSEVQRRRFMKFLMGLHVLSTSPSEITALHLASERELPLWVLLMAECVP